MGEMDKVVYFNSFFLSLDQWKSRRTFKKCQRVKVRRSPLPIPLCVGNGSLLSLNREGCLSRFLDGLQNNE